MAHLFPEIVPDICRRGWRDFATMIEAADGTPQFNVPHSYLQAKFHIEFGSVLSLVDRKTVINHWKAARTSTFTFFDFHAKNGIDDVKIGTGDGFQTAFTIPGKETSGRTIKKAGVTQTEGTHFTYSPGSGVEGEDQAVFAVAPAAGAEIRAAADVGRRRHYLIYLTREIDETHVEADIWSLVLDAVERMPPS